MSNSREETMKLFQSGDTAFFLSIHQRTLNNWAKGGKIKFRIDRTNGRRLFHLTEINRIRTMQQMPELTDQEAINIWKERHGGYYE